MPFVVVHDNGLQDLARLAGNAGLYTTGRQNLHDQLAADSQAYHQQANGDANARAILQDLRARDVAGQNNAARFGVADLNGQNRLAVAGVNGDNRLAVAGANNDARTTIAQANNDARAGLQGDRLAFQGAQGDLNRGLTERGQDLSNGLGYDRMAQQREQFAAAEAGRQQRQQEELRVRQHLADLQLRERAATAEQRQAMAAQRTRLMTLLRERQMNEERARAGDGNAGARVGQLNADIAALLDGGGQPAPPSNGARFDGQPLDAGYGPEGGPGNLQGVYDEPQPQAGPAPIRSDAEYDQLPPGAAFVAPDGTLRQKPAAPQPAPPPSGSDPAAGTRWDPNPYPTPAGPPRSPAMAAAIPDNNQWRNDVTRNQEGAINSQWQAPVTDAEVPAGREPAPGENRNLPSAVSYMWQDGLKGVSDNGEQGYTAHRVNSPQEYARLNPGAYYEAPDGSVRRKQ